MAPPALPVPGDVFHHPRYYEKPPGDWHAKYFVILCRDKSGDYLFRLLTSKHENERPKAPPCFHGEPYPGYFIGVLGGPLALHSWVDLRVQNVELEASALLMKIRQGAISYTTSLDKTTLTALLDCASRTDDVMARHAQAMRDQLALLA